MPEKDVIQSTKWPSTFQSLVENFKTLGLQSNDTCIVHIAMSKIGFVVGAQRTIIEALQAVLKGGTLVMPTQSGDLSDPAEWENPPVPIEWIETIRNHMPAFDIDKTPTRGVGRVAELFRTFPNVYRSNHPQVSFSAWGVHAKYVTENHVLTPMFGNDSPLKKLYDLDAKIVLIGTDYDSVTALHYAEFLAQNRVKANHMSYVMQNGVKTTMRFEDYDYDNDDFNEVGKLFESQNHIEIGYVGDAKSKLFSMRKLIASALIYYL